MRTHLEAVDLEVVDAFCDVLKPYYDATHLVSSQTNITISLIHPLKSQILSKLKITEVDHPAVKTLKTTLHDDLKTRYNTDTVTN